jgi:hypothetical protein
MKITKPTCLMKIKVPAWVTYSMVKDILKEQGIKCEVEE